jgi:GTP-binding protein
MCPTSSPASRPARSAKPATKALAKPSFQRPVAALSAEAKAAMGWAHTATFLTTASQLSQLGAHETPEIAFVGRSNAGKSTAINTIAQQRQLAFASKTPGRTQHINLFTIGPREAPDVLWADLPGYGYAAVERSAKLRWQQVMADYLAERRNLAGVVQMVDSRHGFTPLDRQLLDFVGKRVVNGEVKLLVLLTKADKLGRKEAAESLRQAQAVLAEFVSDEADIGITLFSALKRVGVEDAAQTLHAWGRRRVAEPLAEPLAAIADSVATVLPTPLPPTTP